MPGFWLGFQTFTLNKYSSGDKEGWYYPAV